MKLYQTNLHCWSQRSEVLCRFSGAITPDMFSLWAVSGAQQWSTVCHQPAVLFERSCDDAKATLHLQLVGDLVRGRNITCLTPSYYWPFISSVKFVRRKQWCIEEELDETLFIFVIHTSTQYSTAKLDLLIEPILPSQITSWALVPKTCPWARHRTLKKTQSRQPFQQLGYIVPQRYPLCSGHSRDYLNQMEKKTQKGVLFTECQPYCDQNFAVPQTSAKSGPGLLARVSVFWDKVQVTWCELGSSVSSLLRKSIASRGSVNFIIFLLHVKHISDVYARVKRTSRLCSRLLTSVNYLFFSAVSLVMSGGKWQLAASLDYTLLVSICLPCVGQHPIPLEKPNDDWPGWPAFFRHWYRGSVHLCSCVPSISIVSIVFSANILLCTPVLMHQHIVCRQPIKHFWNGLSFIMFIKFGLCTHTMGFYFDWIHNISMSWKLLHSWCIDSTACKHAHRLKKRWH